MWIKYLKKNKKITLIQWTTRGSKFTAIIYSMIRTIGDFFKAGCLNNNKTWHSYSAFPRLTGLLNALYMKLLPRQAGRRHSFTQSEYTKDQPIKRFTSVILHRHSLLIVGYPILLGGQEGGRKIQESPLRTFRMVSECTDHYATRAHGASTTISK